MRTIRHRVLLALVTTGIVPLVALLLMTDFMIGSSIRTSEQDKVTGLNRAVGAHVGALMAGASQDLKAMQTNRLLRNPNASLDERLKEMLRLVEVYNFISDISMYDLDGFLVSSTTDDYPRYRDQSHNFRLSVEESIITFSRAYREVGRTGLFLSVYIPVLAAESSRPEHMLVARLDYGQVVDLVSEVRPGTDGRILLLDGWGNMLSTNEESDSLSKFDDKVTLESWIGNPEGIYQDPDGQRFLYRADLVSLGGRDASETSWSEKPWVLISLLPEEEVKALLRRSQTGVALVALATLAMAAGIGWVISYHLSSPLVKLSEAASCVAEGNLDIRAEGRGSVEIEQLANSFNLMVEELGEHREGLERLVLSRTASLRHSQAALEQASARLQSAIDSTNNGFLVEDTNGNIAVVNQLFLDLLSVDPEREPTEQADQILRIFETKGALHEGSFDEWKTARTSGHTIDAEVTIEGEQPKVLHVFSSPIRDRRGNLAGRVWNTRDLTDRRNLEESLRQSQKMEAVGQLAGGVAHDFNNLLTGIVGNLALVSIELGKSEENQACRSHLELALKAGDRAAELVKQLLGFSRRSQMDLKPCDVNLVVNEVRDLLSATIDRRIEIATDQGNDSWRVMADLSLLSQVVMNMAVNAKDAMPRGGKLSLRTREVTLGEEEARLHPDATTGDYVSLTIEDDGEGIPLDLQKKVFEPFFTTKEPGKGTGLGLATSFGIVKQLGGWIDMESIPGKGTRFDIFLPRSEAAEIQGVEKARTLDLPPAGRPRKEQETILLVDDEDMVRNVAATLLDKLGYRVLHASDGIEGLEVYGEHEEEIDLVLLDLSMPRMSGRETFSRLRETYGDVPVLICSGYLVDLNEFAGECGACPDGFVQKPYRLEDMSDAVKATLDGRKVAA